MYNRYQGNSGRVEHVTERHAPRELRERPRQSPPPARAGGGQMSGISNLLQRFSLNSLEPEDMILLLILYLLYRESGDRELLITLGAMLFL